MEEFKVWHYFIQLAEGVTQLNLNNIIHMDLKPDNILIDDKTKTIKISDFGNSKMIKESDGESKYFKQGVATWQTMPPEMIVGQKFGAKADTWALGVILYQLCALKHPFEKRGKVEPIPILTKPADYSTIENNYSAETIEFIKKCLSKDTKDRPYLSSLIFDFHLFFAKLQRDRYEKGDERYNDYNEEVKKWKQWKQENEE